MEEIFIILDYNNRFYAKSNNIRPEDSLNLISSNLKRNGFIVKFLHYHEVNLRDDSNKGRYILYQSSEDINLLYKDYIGDILYGLELKGAILIPEYKYFKAHHNKTFMEILRDISNLEIIKTINTKKFGCLEDFLISTESIPFPNIFKKSYGAASRGVFIGNNIREGLRIVRKISRSISVEEIIKKISLRLLHDTNSSIYRRKFIVQNFIKNVPGDYKILVFDKKYYVLNRKNRTNDFRASGSGLLSFEKDLPKGLLDYAEKIFHHFEVPYISLDIGFDESTFHLFEFQFVFFGTLALEKSNFYFYREDESWKIRESSSNLEDEISNSIVNYIHNKYEK